MTTTAVEDVKQQPAVKEEPKIVDTPVAVKSEAVATEAAKPEATKPEAEVKQDDAETKQKAEEKHEDKPDDEIDDDIEMDGTRWRCPTCQLYNTVSQWQCMACYTPMRTLFRAKMFKMQRKLQYEQRQEAREAKKLAQQQEVDTAKVTTDGDRTVTTVVGTADDEVKAAADAKLKATATPIKLEIPGLVVPKVMRALVKVESGKGFKLVDDYPVPEPGDGELLVRTFAVSICGSDRILYQWPKEAEVIAKVPFIPGHECAGLIVKRGAYMKRNRKSRLRFQIGARVAVENHLYCNECFQCKHGRHDICANMGQFGHGKGTPYGGCAEYFLIQEKYCYEIQSHLSWRDVALLEPLGVAVNACNNAEIVKFKSESVLVIGCGPIGCMVCAVARAHGATRVIACDIVPWKLEIATAMGATDVFNSQECNLVQRILELTDNVGVGRLIECSGNAFMVNQSFKCLRKGGNIVLVGLPKSPLHVEDVLTDVIFRSIQLRTIHGRRIENWKTAESLVSDGQINLDPIVLEGHGAIPLSDFEKGYEALFSGKAMKVVFDPTK